MSRSRRAGRRLMSKLSDDLIATAETVVESAQVKVEKAQADLDNAEAGLKDAQAKLKEAKAAPEVPDAEHSGEHTVTKL